MEAGLAIKEMVAILLLLFLLLLLIFLLLLFIFLLLSLFGTDRSVRGSRAMTGREYEQEQD